IVCGGDGTINMVARHIIRRTIPLGIIPMGRFNNIYRSLYGEPDFKRAVANILSGKDKKIDYGLASGEFFIGCVSLGFIPQLYQLIQSRKQPRFAISWSRLAAQAAAMVELKPLSIKVDAFAFDFTPQILSINLLSHIAGIPIIPSCIPGDGKCEVIFDIGEGRAIMSSFVRQLFKQKYLYSDDVRLYRGERITVSPVEGQKAYIDGEIVSLRAPELRIEIFSQKIRVFYKPDTVKQ
ncbi:MAG: diacylglycerol kinase family protein, partial [Candidatus Zixiibacteriota bacterium]